MTDTKHTLVPWKVSIAPSGTPDITDAKGNVVAAVFGGNATDNAAHIVKCVNLHDELVDALKCLFTSYKELADSGDAGFWKLEEQDEGEKALEALKKAGAL